MATLPLSQIEGKYEILAKIKEGGMGAIYKVRHRLLDEIRVVKVMRPQIADSEDQQRRFAREARAAIRLKHPNIAQLYDFAAEADGVAYMVMEFIDGVTLQEMLAKNGPAPLDLTLEMARQGLEALRYLHAHGYVHRDVAPDNLMLTKDFAGQPQIKLIDLGIVKHLAVGAEGLTATGTFLGKVRYSSPEQFSGEKGGVDQRSDIYSFGVMLYELLTGRCPIVGENLSQLVAAHLFQPPLPFEQTDPQGVIPEEIRAAVMRSLAKAPAERIATAQELQELLVRHRKAQDLMQDLETTLATTLQVRADTLRPQPGTTQDQLDERFGLVKTPGPGAGLRAADGVTAESAADQQIKLFASAQRLAQERKWEEARLLLYQVLGINPDHAEVRELLASVEASRRQAVEEEKRRQAIAQASARLDTSLREERVDDAARELERARTELGATAELSGFDQRIAALRVDLAERARQREIAEENERREREAAARRERVRALLAEASELAGREAFADAIARAEQALELDSSDAAAREALEEYRTAEARRVEEIRRQTALRQAAAKIDTLLSRGQVDDADRELEAAIAALGPDPRLEQLRAGLDALRRKIEERERERARQEAIAVAVAAIDSHLAGERADEAQRALAEAKARLGEDAGFGEIEPRIARLRSDLAERERQRVLELRRREEAERRKQEEERRQREEQLRQQEEERQRKEAEARRLAEERRSREEAEARRLEEERKLRAEAEAKRQEEERRLRAEAEARRREEEQQRAKAEAQRRREEERLHREEAAARSRRLEQMLSTAKSDLAAGELERALAGLEAGRAEHGTDAAWQGLVSRAQAEMERREEERKRLEQVNAEAAAVAKLIDKGRLDRAEQRVLKAREELGEAEAWSSLAARIDAARGAEAEERQRAAAEEERSRAAAEAEKRRAAEEEEQRRAVAEQERQRVAAEKEQRRAAEQERKRRAAEEEKQRRAAEEEERERAAAEEASRRLARERERAAAAAEQARTRVAEEPQPRVEAVPMPPARPIAGERPGIKPAYWAAAAGLALLLGLGGWALMSRRSGPTPATPTTETAVENGARTADASGALEPESPRVPPVSGSGSSAAAPRPQAQTEIEDQRETADRPATRPNAAAVDAQPRASAQERTDRRSGADAGEVRSPGAASAPASRDAAQRSEGRKPEPAAVPTPQTRTAPPAPPPPVEPQPRSSEVTRLPVEQLPAPQPTAVAARPAAPPDRPAETAPTVAAPPPPPVAAEPNDRDAVLATLGRYRAAYESLDANAVAQVFTGVDLPELRRAFRQSKSMTVTIDVGGCQTSVDGDRATATCNVTRVIYPKAGESVSRSQRETFHLRRTQQSWVVEQVR